MNRSIINKPWNIIIMGPTASGKTTLGMKLYNNLEKKVTKLKLYDGDEIRKLLTKNYSHSLEDRFAVLKEYIEIIRKDNQSGMNTILCTVLHKNSMRELVDENLDNVHFIYLNSSTEVCEKRDYKGLYKQARENIYDCFPGITEPYELPSVNHYSINGDQKSINDCYKDLMIYISENIEIEKINEKN